MNNEPWTKREEDEIKGEWEKTTVAASVFAVEYATGSSRSFAAIRQKVGDMIRAGTIETHSPEIGPAQVLVLDIETLPMVCYSWDIHDVHLTIENIIKDTCMLSFSATWLYSGKIMSWALTAKEAKARDDVRIVQEAWKLLEKAEVTISHNGRSFDLPKLNARFLFHGLKPPSMYKIIDTCRDVRAMGTSSKKLDYLAHYTEDKHKIRTDYQLWKDCDAGDMQALRKMEKYNRYDVILLEEVYTVLRPWITNHPNFAAYEDHASDKCPACKGSLTWTRSRWPGKYLLYPTFRCKKCGAVGRGRFAA